MPAPEDTPLLPAASDQKDTFKGYVTIFVGCVILVGLSFLCYELAEQGYLVDILDKINEYPTSQKFAVYFLVLYFWVLACLPSSLLEIGSGFVLGMWLGTLVSVVGTTTASLTIFLLCRATSLRGYAEEHVFATFTFAAGLQAAFEESPYTTALALRFAFVPIGLQNVGVAVMPVPVAAFLCSWIADLTYALAYAYVGAQCKSLADVSSGGGSSGSTTAYVILGIGIVMLIAIFAFAKRSTDRLLADLAERDAKAKRNAEAPLAAEAPAPGGGR